MSPLVQLFKLPSLTVNAIQASSRKQAGNIINDVAWAKVTIRLVPDQKPEKDSRAAQGASAQARPLGRGSDVQDRSLQRRMGHGSVRARVRGGVDRA